MNMFRTLRADEIDCRIAQIKKTNDGAGLSLLLYKDARCDQNILDETVGPMNWERKHSRENANCTVSIWDEHNQRWVSKEDTGTESNTEKEKGLASDSFKRACFNWGIGRELYTAPFIWISGKDCNIVERNGKLMCYDRFTVHGIGYTDGVITGLEIKNQKTGKICYRFGKVTNEAPEKPEQPDNEPEERQEPGQNNAQGRNFAVKSKQIPAQTPEVAYLIKAMKELREEREINPEENKKLFNIQKTVLVEGGLAPNKDIKDYTLDELKNLIDAMRKNFTPTGTEMKVG